MGREFLKIGGFYEVTYSDKKTCYVKVLNIFLNNFIEVWCREHVDYSRYGGIEIIRNSSFCMGAAARVFINLNQVESLREINIED